jgi:histidine triad (HIT) family protein
MTYSGQDFYCDMALSGKVERNIVYEDADVLAFHHTKPHWPVHIVGIPKRHTPFIYSPRWAKRQCVVASYSCC